jgi:hypothetical protein
LQTNVRIGILANPILKIRSAESFQCSKKIFLQKRTKQQKETIQTKIQRQTCEKYYFEYLL